MSTTTRKKPARVAEPAENPAEPTPQTPASEPETPGTGENPPTDEKAQEAAATGAEDAESQLPEGLLNVARSLGVEATPEAILEHIQEQQSLSTAIAAAQPSIAAAAVSLGEVAKTALTAGEAIKALIAALELDEREVLELHVTAKGTVRVHDIDRGITNRKGVELERFERLPNGAFKR